MNLVKDSTLTLRASAEGISVSIIIETLKKIHGATEHGVWHDDIHDSDVVDYHGIPEYRGGYMYSGWRVEENTILPGGDIVETRWSKSPTSNPTTPKGEWEVAVKAASVGATLSMTCSLEYVDETTVIKTGPDTWTRRIKDGKFAAIQKALGVTLYEGIREEVAKTLGVETSNVFHQCFDHAVEALINRPY